MGSGSSEINKALVTVSHRGPGPSYRRDGWPDLFGPDGDHEVTFRVYDKDRHDRGADEFVFASVLTQYINGSVVSLYGYLLRASIKGVKPGASIVTIKYQNRTEFDEEE